MNRKYSPDYISDEEIDKAIQEFLDNGGQIIEIPNNFNPDKKNSKSAIKLGKHYRQMRNCKK